MRHVSPRPTNPRLNAVVLMLLLTAGLTGCFVNNNPTPAQEAADAEAAPIAPPLEEMKPTKFNMNTASESDFMTIPGVGERMVREFLEYRPYNSIVQFRREIGKYVDESQVTEYEKYVFVPVDPNNSDAQTMMQLPGVDQSVVDELDLIKPFQSKDDFVAALSEYVTPQQLAEGRAFLVEE